MTNENRLPYGVSQYYRSLARSNDPGNDPIAAQFVPTEQECTHLPYETADPLADGEFEVSSRVLHHYPDRVLILANDRCATYCRHCFRRHFTANDTGRITMDQIRTAAQYVRENEAIQEALISGGDPLMLPDEHLLCLMRELRGVRPTLLLRLATRMPVVQPARITVELAAAMRELAPVWVVTHANHYREVTPEFEKAISCFVDNGIPVLNQTVLLRKVNDDPDALEALFRALLRTRVKPYYLFQGDLASGTSHFRTSIDRGLEIMRELRRRMTGLAIPTYAVDLPGGGGKIELSEQTVVRREESWYVLRDLDGNEHRYPREKGLE